VELGASFINLLPNITFKTENHHFCAEKKVYLKYVCIAVHSLKLQLTQANLERAKNCTHTTNLRVYIIENVLMKESLCCSNTLPFTAAPVFSYQKTATTRRIAAPLDQSQGRSSVPRQTLITCHSRVTYSHALLYHTPFQLAPSTSMNGCFLLFFFFLLRVLEVTTQCTV